MVSVLLTGLQVDRGGYKKEESEEALEERWSVTTKVRQLGACGP